MRPSRDEHEPLRLAALDTDDLAILSAHLQDAVIRVGDLAFLPDERRFALLARRFDWEGSESEHRRRLTGLHFDRVLRCRTRNLDRGAPDRSVCLLAMTFVPDTADEPSGTLTLAFSGGVTIELGLECIEARMKDLGPVWACTGRPAHDLQTA